MRRRPASSSAPLRQTPGWYYITTAPVTSLRPRIFRGRQDRPRSFGGPTTHATFQCTPVDFPILTLTHPLEAGQWNDWPESASGAGVWVSRGGPGQWGFVNLVRAGTQQP